jgi:hypothetical protein
MTLTPQIVARCRLTPATRMDMFALHSRHFSGVRQEKFFADLDEKDWVILLRDTHDVVVGFSTQKRIVDVPGADGTKFLFSGDTIISPEHWNTPYLSGCFGHLMLRLIGENPATPLYWFLTSKGFRTYRFLPVFFNRFWPGPDTATPPEIHALLKAVAAASFGAAFDTATGLVRIPAGDRLSPSLAEIPPSKQADRFVRFFIERNPDFADGAELACLAPISRDNLNALANRVIAQTRPEWIL